MMSEVLRILILEDRPADAELMLREVRKEGIEFAALRVETEADFRKQLLEFRPDLILADYSLPSYDGMSALTLAHREFPGVPFILVSGTLGEEIAVEGLHHGATDYVLKDRLSRLGAAVRRALLEVEERKELHRAEAQRERLAALVEASPDFIGFADAKTTQIQYINKYGRKMCGIGEDEELGGLKISDVHPAWMNQRLAEILLPAAVRDGLWEGEGAFLHRDGRDIPVLMALLAHKAADGEVDIFYTVSHNITERKLLEAQFLQAQKMESVGRLAGGIAHDFNNLLTVILGTVDLAQTNRTEDDPLYADLQELRKAGELAAGLTRQLLAFSRRQILQPKVLSLNTLLPDMLAMFQRLLGEDVTVAFIPGIDLDFVRVDPVQIEQVLINLAINARDAMPRGGTLTIETRNVTLDEAYAAGHPAARPGPHVQLLVSDTGIGMDESTRLQAFEPFFTTKSAGTGTGLGLSTVYGIVKQSGGSIWVESELGRGSCFDIYLPRSAGPLTATATVAVESASRGSETILIVEDEAPLRSLARRFLEGAGYTVLDAENGDAALACLEHHAAPVDLVLTDLVMPGMGGRELAKRLSARFPKLKIVFTSGYTDEAILHQGPFDDGTHFLAKPYTMAGLRTKVRNVLDSPGDLPTGA
jgi:PAS domain S-box-containing protein